MGDDLTVMLNEIATLLRRQIEQHDAIIRRTEEMRTKMIVQPHLQGIRQRVEENREKWERSRETREASWEGARERAAQMHEEDKQFKERLLAELERHNRALESLLTRLLR